MSYPVIVICMTVINLADWYISPYLAISPFVHESLRIAKCPSIVASALVAAYYTYSPRTMVRACLPRALPAEAPALCIWLTLRDLVDFMSK